jgi:hypothetical protein
VNGRLPGRIHLIARLDHVSHHDRLDLGMVELGAREHGAHRRRAQLGGRRLVQSTAECADGGAKRRRENNVTVWHEMGLLFL